MVRKRPINIDPLFDVYCFRKVDVGVANAYLPLNRKYRPLGDKGDGFIDYDDYANWNGYVVLDRPAAEIRVWTQQCDYQFWLYDDGLASRMDYSDRLAKLHKHEVA